MECFGCSWCEKICMPCKQSTPVFGPGAEASEEGLEIITSDMASGRRRVRVLTQQVSASATAADEKAHEMMAKIREVCGPFNHHGHVVADMRKAMNDWLAIGVGPWFFFTADREKRWDEQAAAGGGRKGKLRPTQLHYGEPTAYRALIAFGYNGETGIELIQPYNDEPSCHNDWLKSRGHGLQHINFTVPREKYVELIDACLAFGWVASIQLIEGDGKPGSGPPGRPDMPTVHYFDLMKEFGFHVEMSCGPGGTGKDGESRVVAAKRQAAYNCYISKTWDGKTDPIRYAYPKVPADFKIEDFQFG